MKQTVFYLLYLTAITAAEIVLALSAVVPAINPLFGVLCHIAILTALILHSAVIGQQSHQRMLMALSLAPLIRIVSLTIPLANVHQLLWFPMVYAPLLAAAVMVVRIFGFKFRDIGVSFGSVPYQMMIALSGFAIGLAEYLILRPEPVIAELTWQAAWLPGLIFLVTTGLVEEFIFRGVMQYTVERVFVRWGIVYISFLFAILHVGFLSWVDVVFVFVVALFFGWMVKKTGSLFGVTLAHGLANTTLYVITPFLFTISW
ncbi:CPBP family intramembrane glutamic endopeptidase [Chloroflexota bacterium]